MIDPSEAQRSGPTSVAGLAAWTSNAAEARPESARIPELWARFTSEGWFERLEHIGAVGPPIAVYTDYRTDVSGDYRIVVGRQVPDGARALPDAQPASIPEGRYLVFHLRGTLPGIVIDGWRHVWRYFEQARPVHRAYSADVEMYHEDGAGLDIWIAIR